MPVLAPLLMVFLVIATIAGMAVTTHNWTQQRSVKLYAELDADIRQMLGQHMARKRKLAAPEWLAPGFTTGSAAEQSDTKAKKAQIGSIRKRTPGRKRDRFVPPDFARLPIAVTRGVIGFLPR